VRLLDCDEASGALLLERLDSTTSLLSVDAAEATRVLAGLLRRLSVPAPPGLPGWTPGSTPSWTRPGWTQRGRAAGRW
jgi:streptomycin 6-kinase